MLSGNGMCVHQAVEAFRLFTGITPISLACIVHLPLVMRLAKSRSVKRS